VETGALNAGTGCSWVLKPHRNTRVESCRTLGEAVAGGEAPSGLPRTETQWPAPLGGGSAVRPRLGGRGADGVVVARQQSEISVATSEAAPRGRRGVEWGLTVAELTPLLVRSTWPVDPRPSSASTAPTGRFQLRPGFEIRPSRVGAQPRPRHPETVFSTAFVQQAVAAVPSGRMGTGVQHDRYGFSSGADSGAFSPLAAGAALLRRAGAWCRDNRLWRSS